MEREINRLLKILQTEYFLSWGLYIGLAALYELDVLPQGLLADNARAEYLLQVTGILLAVGLIVLSLRQFNRMLNKHIRHLPLRHALTSYRRWNEIRLALLLTPTLLNLSSYYLTMDTTGLLCAGMTMIASLFCVPSRRRIIEEMNLSPAESDHEA